MGVNKKFLLLAFLIVTSVSYSYGDKVLTEDTKSSNSKNQHFGQQEGQELLKKM